MTLFAYRLSCSMSFTGWVTINRPPVLGEKMAKLDTRAVGLDAGLAAIKFLTGKENLHYGIWDGLEPNAGNIAAAQEAYTER